jgi:hypothetical protein
MKLYNHFTDEVKLNSKIVSFYSDNSGASLFARDAEGAVLNAEGEYLSTDYFLDAGYCHFAYLPKGFKLWHEIKNDI